MTSAVTVQLADGVMSYRKLRQAYSTVSKLLTSTDANGAVWATGLDGPKRTMFVLIAQPSADETVAWVLAQLASVFDSATCTVTLQP